jgi:penicillin-binding protein 1C
MLALHAGRPGHAPPRPTGVSAAPVTFASGHEGARREWFLDHTAQAVMALAPAFARRPHITSPVSGSVYAWDPDIPPDRQSIGVAVAGDAANLRLSLDGHDFAEAAGTPQLPLVPGSHLLTLLDEGGRPLDRVRFTIR